VRLLPRLTITRSCPCALGRDGPARLSLTDRSAFVQGRTRA